MKRTIPHSFKKIDPADKNRHHKFIVVNPHYSADEPILANVQDEKSAMAEAKEFIDNDSPELRIYKLFAIVKRGEPIIEKI